MKKRLQACRQARQPAQRDTGPPDRTLRIVQLQIWKTADQPRNGDLGFQASKLRAQTMMDAAAEGERADVLARDVEAIGLAVDIRITVGRYDHANDRPTLLNHAVAQRYIFERRTRRELNQRIVAQEFFDGVTHQRAVASETRQLVGMTEQRKQAVADEIGRRVVSGREQQNNIGGQFLLRQPLALFLREHQ